LLQHPFVRRGLQFEPQPLLKNLVSETLPLLKAARAKRKNQNRAENDDADEDGDEDSDESGGDNDDRGTFKPGTIITVNTSSKEWSHDSNYGTTVINADTYDTINRNK